MLSPSHQRYRVLELLGQGGFARVYRAEMIGEGGFRQLVALKFVRDGIERQDEILARLRDEARILGLLRHRAIVGVHGLAHLDRGWAVVMEYVDGVDGQRLMDGTMPPVPVILELVAEVASALQAAWEQPGHDGAPLRLVHRDIKPANIFVTGQGQVKVLDFGAARAEFADRESETRSVMFGSIRYMSPERFDGVDGPESDVWALGITLAELLLGVPATPEHVGTPDRAGKGAHLAQTIDGYLADTAPAMEAEQRRELCLLVREMLAVHADHRPRAGDVDVRLRRLVRQIPGDDMRTWTPQHVPAILAAVTRDTEADEVCGAVLRQYSDMSANVPASPPHIPVASDSDTPPVLRPAPAPVPSVSAPSAPAPREPVPSRSVSTAIPTGVRWGLLAGVAVGAALLCGGGMGVSGLYYASLGPEPEVVSASAPPTTADVPAKKKAPESTAVVPKSAPKSAPKASPKKSTKGKTTAKAPPKTQPEAEPETPPETAPKKVTPAPAPSPAAAAATTTVRVTGDVSKVRFVGGGRRVSPTDAGPGSWTVVGVLPGATAETTLGTVDVREGQDNVFACSAAFKECVRR